MKFLRKTFVFLILQISLSVATTCPSLTPTVKIDNATIIGTSDGVVSQFLGIPFALPPIVVDCIFRSQYSLTRKMQSIQSYTGIINATTFGDQCMQQPLAGVNLPADLPPEISAFLSISSAILNITQSEDCLNLNVITPAGTTVYSKLPVVMWIYGGGFQFGSNAALILDPDNVIVNKSIELQQSVIYVAMNYRLSALGFLGGKEVKDAGVGNLGLHDQREALRWVQKYISLFGGDPTKVTIWGESAGAVSVAMQMLASDGNTEGLFRAGFMNSGSVLPNGKIDNAQLQSTYDFIVSETGCSSASDTLQCVREVPLDVLMAAVDKTPTISSPQSLAISWFPRADGVFLKDDDEVLLSQGKVAEIPFVIGDVEDEGTLFSLSLLNLTTDAEFVDYITGNYLHGLTSAEIDKLLELYPADPAVGSPYGTGNNFTFTREYKRLASFQGDLIFQAPRRQMLQQLSCKVHTWSFISKRLKVPGIGAPHGTDLEIVYGGGDMADYLIRFVSTLNPNGATGIDWPPYTEGAPHLLEFLDGNVSLKIGEDTFRREAIEFVTELSLAHPN